jgi:NADH dehydrogenase (ubiquinone) 1 alpha subcomplex subunit 2
MYCKGARHFIETHYVGLKASNPKFPILIREFSGVQTRLYARYDFGNESSISLANFKAEGVLKWKDYQSLFYK